MKLYRVITKFAEGTQLPFDVVKGSPKERNKKAEYFSKKFQQIIDKNYPNDEFCSIKTFDKVLKETIHPHNIKVNYARETGKFVEAGMTKSIVGCERPNLLEILIKNFKFNFRTVDTSQKDIPKSVVVHEARHFFDDICNPKTSIYRYNGLNNEEYANNVNLFFAKITSFRNKYSISTIKKDFEKISKILPQKSQIDLLQRIRYRLNTENNAYKDELTYLLKHPIKNFNKILSNFIWLKTQACINSRQKTITKLLKNILELKK